MNAQSRYSIPIAPLIVFAIVLKIKFFSKKYHFLVFFIGITSIFYLAYCLKERYFLPQKYTKQSYFYINSTNLLNKKELVSYNSKLKFIQNQLILTDFDTLQMKISKIDNYPKSDLAIIKVFGLQNNCKILMSEQLSCINTN